MNIIDIVAVATVLVVSAIFGIAFLYKKNK